MSTRNRVEVDPEATTKVFSQHERFERELTFYRRVPWAAPKLLKVYNLCLIIETLPTARSQLRWQPRRDLITLLERIHDAGVNHMDVQMGNIVMGPDGKPRLIDWEWATDQVGEISFDIHGPGPRTIANPNEKIGRPMWIGAHHSLSIRRWWR